MYNGHTEVLYQTLQRRVDGHEQIGGKGLHFVQQNDAVGEAVQFAAGHLVRRMEALQ